MRFRCAASNTLNIKKTKSMKDFFAINKDGQHPLECRPFNLAPLVFF